MKKKNLHEKKWCSVCQKEQWHFIKSGKCFSCIHKGWIPSEETKQNMSLGKKGHKTLKSTRQKIGEANKGKKNGMYKLGLHTKDYKNKCMDCGNYTLTPLAKRCKSCSERFNKLGDKNPMKERCGAKHFNWKGGSSFEPYSSDFNEALKEKIRNRDNRTCQLCGIKEEELNRKLDVHHIDYDKKNCNEENLISLCKSCHMKTNFKRKYYRKAFAKIKEYKD